ncbi:MAG: hypothetical protein Kow0026_08470 [Oricola sp.]
MNSVAEIIASLGTNVEVAEGIDVKPSTVSEFKRRNSLPVRYWQKFISFAETKGVAVTPEQLMAAHTQPAEAAE